MRNSASGVGGPEGGGGEGSVPKEFDDGPRGCRIGAAMNADAIAGNEAQSRDLFYNATR